MCDFCSSVYHSDTKHEFSVCPIWNAAFCSVCQVRGHFTMKCPDRGAWKTRSPEYLEQLIPPSVRELHQIRSRTPMNPNSMEIELNDSIPEYGHESVMEVPIDTTGAFIRATLASHNLPISGIKKNKAVLEAFGAHIGKKVVYIQNKNDVLEKTVTKARKAIRLKKTASPSSN